MNNERGQAAIFVALMFNVLFVLFAMAINVALVVHDKINLQNSADLAAYYAASKQAEILNAIAHNNYQIRQSYKLLAWRYRVLGQMGYERIEPHPVRSGALSESPYRFASTPALCIRYSPTWVTSPLNENICNTPNLKIPPLPSVPAIAGFLGLNMMIEATMETLRNVYGERCDALAAYNWWFSMSILHAFRLDQRNRKQVIFGLAGNLSRSSSDGDFLDLDGNSVIEGAKQTFVKNLTFANRASFESGGGEFRLNNSLAGVDPTSWLSEVRIAPTIVYTDTERGIGCNSYPAAVQNEPARPGAKAMAFGPAPKGLGGFDLREWAIERILMDVDYQYSMGVEKNPWYMAYVGVRVSTTPRQVFFPLGGGISMVARSFAKPFGGRIGPWHKSKWEKGAKNSDGRLTDPLIAPRAVGSSFSISPTDLTRLPNYSRYPGDELGLYSRLALNALNGMARVPAAYDFYKNIKADFVNGGANDILAWDYQNNRSPDIRDYEIAAIAPDLFDITYYSIEPNYYANYFQKIKASALKFGIPSTTQIRPDLGASNLLPKFSVQDQISLASAKGIPRPEVFYMVRDKAHLLTAWLPGPGAFNYDTNESLQNFGKCGVSDDGLKLTNPGSCLAGGGRTGYSVKLVSRDALLSGAHKIGGPEAAAGGIMNPPNPDEGW